MESANADGGFEPGLREIVKGRFSSGEGPVDGVRLEFTSGIAAICTRRDLSAREIGEIHRLSVLYVQEVEKAESTPAIRAGAAGLAEQLRGRMGSFLGYFGAAESEADTIAAQDVAGLGALVQRLQDAPKAIAARRLELARELRALGVVLIRCDLVGRPRAGFPLEGSTEVANAA